MKKTIIIIFGTMLILSLGMAIGINLPKQNLSNNNNNDIPKEENNVNNENDNHNNSQNEEKYNPEFFNEIITTQLQSLFNKKSLNELTNQERLYLLLQLYRNQNDYEYSENIKVEDLRVVHQSSIIKNLSINYTDIYDRYTSFVSDEKGNMEIAYKYNPASDNYTNTGLGHGGNIVAKPLYKELMQFTNKDNTYTIEYKYVFGNSYGDGPTPYELYYSGIDAYNEKNSFKKQDDNDCTGEYCTDYETPMIEYIENNYDQIKNKLSTYAYTFKLDNNQLIITSFSVK